jgi:hypothetical protein
MTSLLRDISLVEQERLTGGATGTVYVRYNNNGFVGGDGYFNNQDSNGLETSFSGTAGEDITESKTKQVAPSSVETTDGTVSYDNYTSLKRLGGESTPLEVKYNTNQDQVVGKYAYLFE